MRLVYLEAFESTWHKVAKAPDGRKGVDSFASKRPDLVITDIEMPELDDHSVISKIGELQADAKIVMVTGTGLHHLPVAHKLGADRIFEKPLRPRDPIVAVEELIS